MAGALPPRPRPGLLLPPIGSSWPNPRYLPALASGAAHYAPRRVEQSRPLTEQAAANCAWSCCSQPPWQRARDSPRRQPSASRPPSNAPPHGVPGPRDNLTSILGNWPHAPARSSSHDAHPIQPLDIAPTEAETLESLPTGDEQIRSRPRGRPPHRANTATTRPGRGRQIIGLQHAGLRQPKPPTRSTVEPITVRRTHTMIPAQSRGNQDARTR
jgi:hypothetical protein